MSSERKQFVLTERDLENLKYLYEHTSARTNSDVLAISLEITSAIVETIIEHNGSVFARVDNELKELWTPWILKDREISNTSSEPKMLEHHCP